MTAVENFDNRPPVIIGYGTKPQEAELRTAGAERVLIHPRQLASLIDMAGLSLRADDTLLMVQPGLLTRKDMSLLLKEADANLLFQVVGHDAFPLTTDRTIAAWRKLTAKGVATDVVALTGRPRNVTYTEQQADAIIRLWHQTPRKMPREVTEIAHTILGLEPDTLKPHWVRDLVIKYVGTAKRDKPASWSGIETKTYTKEADDAAQK